MDTQAIRVLECVEELDDERMVCLGQHSLLSHDVFALLFLQDELLFTHLDCNRNGTCQKAVTKWLYKKAFWKPKLLNYNQSLEQAHIRLWQCYETQKLHILQNMYKRTNFIIHFYNLSCCFYFCIFRCLFDLWEFVAATASSLSEFLTVTDLHCVTASLDPDNQHTTSTMFSKSTIQLMFCHLEKGLTPKSTLVLYCHISVLYNCLCVWIGLYVQCIHTYKVSLCLLSWHKQDQVI